MSKTRIKFVKARAILQYGSERNRWAYAARELRTAQTALLRREHKRSLDELPGAAHLYGWVTDTGRPLGIGFSAASMGRKGERIARIDLPIPTSGVQLQKLAERHIRSVDRKNKRETPAQKRGKFRVVGGRKAA